MVLAIAGQPANFEGFAWGLLREKAPEFPQTYKLSKAHENELLKSAITREQALGLGIFTVTAKEAEVLTGHKYAGLCIPYFEPTGELQRWGPENKPFCRLKPSKPVFGAKYLSPKGAGNHAYYPTVKKKKNNVLVIGEGEKTTGSFALNTPFDVIGLGGVWSFYEGEKGEKDRPLLTSLSTKIFSQRYEQIVLCFDSDVVSKPEVQQAIRALAKELMIAARARGDEKGGEQGAIEAARMCARLKYVVLPQTSGKKQGLDDLIWIYGVDPVIELFEYPLPMMKQKKPSKDNPGDYYECVFKAEPLYQSKVDETAINEAMARAIVLTLGMKQSCLMVPDLSPFLYNESASIWQPVGREAWQQSFYKACSWQRWKQQSRSAISEARGVAEGRLSRSLDGLDPLEYIGFENGTLDVNTEELEPNRPEHFVTRRMGYDYLPNRQPLKFLQWMDWIFDDVEAIDAIQGLLRWILEPKKSEAYELQLLFFLIGKPGVGKSTLLEVMKQLAGNASTFDATRLNQPEHLFGLRNKRIIYQADLKGIINEQSIGALNKIADNTELEMRKLYNDGTEARLNTVVCLAANKPPQISVNDRAGFDRRAVYFRFDKKPKERVRGFTQSLLDELPGIFNWAYEITVEQAHEAIESYQNGELQKSVSLKAIKDSNTILQWLEEEHDNESDQIQPVDYVYGLYVEWCKTALAHAFSKRKFIVQMEAMGCSRTRPANQGRKYCFEWPPLKKMNLHAIAEA